MCIFLISRKHHLPPGLLLIECESTARGSLVLAALAITPTELMTTAIPAPRKPDTWLVNHIMWETVMSAQLLEIHEIIHMDIIFRIQTAWINWIIHSNLENHLHICIKHKCHLLTSMVILFHLTNFKFIQSADFETMLVCVLLGLPQILLIKDLLEILLGLYKIWALRKKESGSSVQPAGKQNAI